MSTERLSEKLRKMNDALLAGGADYSDILLASAEWIIALEKCCTQRGARMQIIRKWLTNQGIYTLWPKFCEDYPEAKDWFDEDGVPK